MTLLGKIIVGIVVGGVVVGGGYYVISFMKNDSLSESQMISEMDNQEEGMQKDSESLAPLVTEKDMSFAELMKKGGSYECSVKQSIMGITTNGTVSLKEGNIRASFSTVVQGRTIDTNMVTKDGYTYSWSSMSPTGVKAKMATGDVSSNTAAPSSASYTLNGATIGSYSCKKASVDTSLFSIPSSITFTEAK